MKTAVQINSAANSDFNANSALMVLDVLMMTSVVAKKFANWEVVKLNQVRIQKLRLTFWKVYTWKMYMQKHIT